MPPVGRSNEPLLIADRAGEAAAAMAEQLAVGELACRRRAVERQEHRGATWRAGVNGARDEVLARAAFAGDQHRQVVPLQALNLIARGAFIAALAQMNPGSSGSSGRSLTVSTAWRRTVAQRRTARSPGARCAANIRNRRIAASANRSRRRDHAAARAVMLLAERFDEQQPVAVLATALMRRTRQGRGDRRVASGARDDAQVGWVTRRRRRRHRLRSLR